MELALLFLITFLCIQLFVEVVKPVASTLWIALSYVNLAGFVMQSVGESLKVIVSWVQ